jgi:hypothetical protein
MRRLVPAAIAALFLSAPLVGRGDDGQGGGQDSRPVLNCGGTTNAARVPPSGPARPVRDEPITPPPPVAPLLPAMTPGGEVETVPVVVEIGGGPRSQTVKRAPLYLEAYPRDALGPDGLPEANRLPRMRFPHPSRDRRWPDELRVHLPTRGTLRMVAWLDVNLDGRLSEGDRIAPAVQTSGEQLVDGTPLQLTIDRPYLASR